MELNKRCVEILKILRYSNDFIKIDTLSSKYHISERSIRYDINKIEVFLQKNGFSYLERHHLKGIKLNEQQGLYEFIDSFMGEYTPYKYIYTEAERFQYMLTKLLQANEPMRLEYFEKRLCVSKNTILKQGEQISYWLKERGLILSKKPRIGVVIEGNEITKRKAIIEIASETITSEEILNFINTKKLLSKISNLQFDNLFSDIDIDYLDSLVRNVEIELDCKFSDVAYGNLITHLAIMIKRLQQNKKIILPDDIGIKDLSESKEYSIALKIIDKLEKHYNICIPIEETKYIALHLLGARVLKTYSSGDFEEIEADELYRVAGIMTTEIEEIYGIKFGDKKQVIIEGLLLHLRPSIYRIKFNLKIINPMFDEIRSNYGELFINTKFVSRHFEKFIGKAVDDHEIAYITLHFGAALENLKEKMKKPARILLVCGTGIGTAKMLASKIQNEFEVQIIDTVSVREVVKYGRDNVDYIISTVDIPYLGKSDFIKVNALLLKNDYIVLKKYLISKNIHVKREKILINKVNEIIDIVGKNCIIRDKEQLQYEIMYKLASREDCQERRYEYMLNDLITSDVIKLNVECKDWVQAIEDSTNILLKRDCIDQHYKEAILNNFRELGPYMVLAPGIVLAHARPECGVKKLSMSLITLKNPVKFGSETNDPVKLIITLAAIDNQTHLKALSQLMDLFMNGEDITKVMKASKKEEIINILDKYSKD